MALRIGQPINGRELEQSTSPWAPERFATMCDALTWATSGRQCPGRFSFTARVNAADGGIDGEWFVDLSDDARSVPTPIVGPGWNVFQYKKRDLIAQDRRRVIFNLKSALAGAISDLEQQFGRPPSRYILFTNVDLKGNEKSALKESILKGYRAATKLQVDIYSAAELAALLNDCPHLRAAYFNQLAFKTWERAHQEHLSRKFIGAGIDRVDRETELDRLRSWVDDARVRVIVLSGPHDIGKSRLALEATRHRPHDVVQALDPRSMALRDYRDLCASHGEVVCIVKDPEPDALESLINEVLGLPHLKLIITLPTLAVVPAPAYGRDERVQSLSLEPLTETKARELLQTTSQSLDFETEDWIIRRAGGIPGVLLVAADVGPMLRRELPTFIEQVGSEFERRIRSELGSDALKCAQLFSILTHVGILGDVETELGLICDLFGDDWTPPRARESLDDLVQAGLARCGGSFAEIAFPLLANYLAGQLLRGRFQEMLALFAKLDDAGRMRFTKRLSEIKGAEVQRFWDAVFAPDGLLNDFQAAFSNIHLLRLIAGSVPGRVLRLLESGLRNSSRTERLKIKGDQRRELVRALEQLLFRSQTGQGAVRLLWLLAEAENETYGNNATGIVMECFHPFHPQIPLSLRERIGLLHELSSKETSEQGKFIAIEAVRSALDGGGGFQVYYSAAPELFDLAPEMTSEVFWDYCRDLVDVLFSFVDAGDDVAAKALDALPRLTAKMGLKARPHDALDRFRTLVDWTSSEQVGLDVSSLVDALCWMRDVLAERLAKSELPPDHRNALQEYVAELNRLKTIIETGGFSTRLKRWTGSEAYGDYENDLASGGRPQFERELIKLADEAIKNPALLTAEHIEWLLSPSSTRSRAFFYYLGQSDEGLIFYERIEGLGQQPDGVEAFAAYWSGWAVRDREAAVNRLDQLTSASSVTQGKSIVLATVWLGVDQTATDRIKVLIQTGRVAPEYVGQALLSSRLVKELTDDQFKQLLETIAGKTFEYGAAAVDMLHMWSHFVRPLHGSLADFAWHCLEHDPPLRAPRDTWKFDRLAAILAEDDPERGLELLDSLVRRNEVDRNHWDPLDVDGKPQFCKVLHTKERERLFDLLLNAAQANICRRLQITWKLRDLLDSEADREALISFASRSVEAARIAASCITSAKPKRFWPIAFDLVQMFPHDEALLCNLTAGLEQSGIAFVRRPSQLYNALKREVEQILREPSTPPEARVWLRDVLGRLEREIPPQIIWEYDLDVDDLHRHIRDKHSAQRLWAIGRVLKYAQWEDVRRLLTVEDIEETLPHVDLPEKRRKMLAALLKVWQHGS